MKGRVMLDYRRATAAAALVLAMVVRGALNAALA
jgi:hypothetical protein